MLKGRDKRLPQVKGSPKPMGKDLRNTNKNSLLVACDGSGKGRVATIVWNKGKLLYSNSVPVQGFREMTSNVAEYFAVCIGLEALLGRDRFFPGPYTRVLIVTDSRLVVNQVLPKLGIETKTPFKIRQKRLHIMANRVVSLWKKVEESGLSLELKWISREETVLWYADLMTKG